jgi:acyl carrier protein
MERIKETIRGYILDEFLPGEDPSLLTESTPLITGGILDSVGTLKLLTFLEGEFRLRLQARDADAETFNTIANIARFVASRLSSPSL